MKKYYLVILKSGPYSTTDKARQGSIFSGHMKNIQWLASQDKLVVAGPLGENDKSYEGIFILNTENKSEAEKWLENDTPVKLKMLTAGYYSYYGSTALQQIPVLHNKIQKAAF